MRVAVVEWPDLLEPEGDTWACIAAAVSRVRPDVLVTNEMPFGPWLARSPEFSLEAAIASERVHETGLAALSGLAAETVLSTRPIRVADRLANEAFRLVDGKYLGVHHKQYMPNEPGWHETSWFVGGRSDFAIADSLPAVGFLVCTELFFNEWARHYRRLGAYLLAVPRSSGQSVKQWHAAAAMAAIVSGCYVASSNRVSTASSSDMLFGGGGFAFAPDGTLICSTTRAEPLVCFEMDLDAVVRRRDSYPCYVGELEPPALDQH